MVNFLKGWFDSFLGSGEAAVTVPPLDGALKPNTRLEDAAPGFAVVQPDCLGAFGGDLYYSSGAGLFCRPAAGGEARCVFEAGAEITAFAVSASGRIAVAAGDGIRFLHADGATVEGLPAPKQSFGGVTALTFGGEEDLIIAIGSSENRLSDWQRDLLDGGRSGSVWRLAASTGQAKQLAGRLRFPSGLAVEEDGNIIVSEAWGKHLVRLSQAGAFMGQVIEDLPGYPARIAPSGRGGYWLAVFAPRNQLIEFVLREPDYRKAMMAEVDKEFWIAPALRSGYSFREPMQGGAMKQMGILKPWAPTRSYGLVIELTHDFVPLRSFHSRAGGRRHGVMGTVEVEGRLWVASKGGDEVFALDVGGH